MPATMGVGTTLSGRYASIGSEMKQAVEMAAQEANVPIYVLDDEAGTQKGEEVAREFCSRPDILGVVGHYSSDVSVAASDIYAQYGLAMITPIASNPLVTDRGLPNVFRYTNRDDNTGRAIAGYLRRELGKRSAVIIESQYAYGRSMAGCFERAFVAAGGEIAARYPVNVGERDFAPLVAGLPRQFDVLFYGGAFEGAPLLVAMRQAGLHQLFAAGDGCWDRANFISPAGDAATAGEGVLVLSATPAVAGEFPERYARRHGPIGNYAVNSYDSARLLLQAMSGAASRQDVVEAIRKIRFQGIAYRNPVHWNQQGDNLSAVTALWAVEHDRFRQVAEIGISE